MPDQNLLNPKELAVLKEVAKGSSNKVIAQTLGVDVKYVERYITRLFEVFEPEPKDRLVLLENAEENDVLPFGTVKANKPPYSPGNFDYWHSTYNLTYFEYRVVWHMSTVRTLDVAACAKHLNITESTVNKHLTSVFAKIGVENKLQTILKFRGKI
jgi:DNA-binding CsgD family transcriptional regulator